MTANCLESKDAPIVSNADTVRALACDATRMRQVFDDAATRMAES